MNRPFVSDTVGTQRQVELPRRTVGHFPLRIGFYGAMSTMLLVAVLIGLSRSFTCEQFSMFLASRVTFWSMAAFSLHGSPVCSFKQFWCVQDTRVFTVNWGWSAAWGCRFWPLLGRRF